MSGATATAMGRDEQVPEHCMWTHAEQCIRTHPSICICSSRALTGVVGNFVAMATELLKASEAAGATESCAQILCAAE